MAVSPLKGRLRLFGFVPIMRPFFENCLKPSPILEVLVNLTSTLWIIFPFAKSPAAFENYSVCSRLGDEKNLAGYLSARAG